MTTNDNNLPDLGVSTQNSDPKTEDHLKKGEEVTMHNAGVDIEEDTKQEVVDVDGATKSLNDSELEKVGLEFVDAPKETKSEDQNNQPKSKETQSVSEEKILSASDLEKEFKGAQESGSDLGQKTSMLSSLLAKVQERLGLKKKEVKGELKELKEMKEDISKDIEEIKDLEEDEETIKQQMEKIEQINKQIKEIEEDVNKGA